MKKLLTILLLSSLIGCASNPILESKNIVNETKYIVVDIPSTMTDIPDKIAIPNENATNTDIAIFISNSEKRSLILENKLISIKEYYDNIIKNLKIPESSILKY